jgi:hypothetical protein
MAEPGRCWRMVYVNAMGHGSHYPHPVPWRGRHKFRTGWVPVWSCQCHADDLVGARRLAFGVS